MTSLPLPRTIHIEEFAPLVGQVLLANCDPQPVALDVVEVTPLVNHAKLERPPFILILRSGPDAMLVTGTYALKGTGFGPDQVHLSQIAAPLQGQPGHYYQSVFN
ncbi:DUF6916 family protein [Sphingomonas faeni]|uniref:DUF6916 family protein n=1 Tax=Sphingomonas faeni TaxID=185950 RepID=UPI0033486CDE